MGFIFFIIGGFLIADLFSKNGHQEQRHDMARMQQMQDMQQQELIRQMNDPYMTPGLDAGIDEAHHGIDHGMGIANPEHNYEGMNDSFFGGGCGGGDFF